MTTVTNTSYLFESGDKVIASLNEAKETLNSAERWAHEDLSSISSFLTIIQGTVNEAKYALAQTTIRTAEEELSKFITLLSDFSVPEALLTNLKNASLPEEIKTQNIFKRSLSHEQYELYRGQIDTVINLVSDIMHSVH